MMAPVNKGEIRSGDSCVWVISDQMQSYGVSQGLCTLRGILSRALSEDTDNNQSTQSIDQGSFD